MSNTAAKKNRDVAKSFKELNWVFTPEGETRLEIDNGTERAPTVLDELSYLDDDIRLLRMFQMTQGDTPWLEGNQTRIGAIRRPVFLEGGFISDSAKTKLLEVDIQIEWLANQGLMIGNAPMIGINKNFMVYFAKTHTFDSRGNVTGRYFPNILPAEHCKDLAEYPKSHIDQIWVWHQESDDQAEDECWFVHPELLARFRYNDLTDEEELALMKFMAESDEFKQAFPNGRLVSGFTAYYGNFRYALVLPELKEQLWDQSKGGSYEKSIYENRNQVQIGWPSFLERTTKDVVKK